jgi:uncharacterized protein (DUF1810 family)/organic hydroperoxide reductase OsmC/OhrA
MADPYDLGRFVAAQDAGGSYDRAIAELRGGRKASHWMWFVFPQIAGLGQSQTSRTFAISTLDEARAYLRHPVLGPRLAECARILAQAQGRSAGQIFGGLDAQKLRSSMTLFLRAAPAEPLFGQVLGQYFNALPDPATDQLLTAPPAVSGRPRTHSYDISVSWTGNRGTGTSGYRGYGRDHDLSADGLPTIAGSSDPAFRGDRGRWNPELELTAALSQCHMLSYLHVCAAAGVTVTAYTDDAHGVMAETADGGGHFVEVVLRPRVTVASEDMIEAATRLHEDASAKCFIASSVNFPVRHEPVVVADGQRTDR